MYSARKYGCIIYGNKWLPVLFSAEKKWMMEGSDDWNCYWHTGTNLEILWPRVQILKGGLTKKYTVELQLSLSIGPGHYSNNQKFE